MGHNPTIAVRDFSGEAGFVPGTLDQAYIRVTVRTDSFEVTDDISSRDKAEIESKMKREVLETDRFTEISFESSSVSATQMGDNSYIAKITGNLSLHGATRNQVISAQVTVAGDTVRAFGEFTLRQTDYGITLVSVAGGTLKIKDELKIAFDFTARKQA
jgi:polyisoprenoid-binding protein YceI